MDNTERDAIITAMDRHWSNKMFLALNGQRYKIGQEILHETREILRALNVNEIEMVRNRIKRIQSMFYEES